MPIGYIKKVSKDEMEYKNIFLGEWQDIERCFYFVENLQNFRMHLKDFSGYINIIIPKLRKSYRNYLHNIQEDTYELGEECNFLIYFEGEGSFKLDKTQINNSYIEIDRLFLEMGYKQFVISQDLLHLKNKIKNAYGLDYYQEEDCGTLVFGVYNNVDLQRLENIRGRVGILWGGSDIMIKSKYREKVLKIVREKNYENFAMSKYIWDKLDKLDIKNCKLVCVSFCWNNINYLRQKNGRKTHIFIYDGIGQSKKKNNIYGIDTVNKFCEGRNNVIRTSKKFIENILDVYNCCFVSLRLTAYDGNANTAQECGMLGIPVISNQEMNHCISWKTLEEIEWKVDYIRRNKVKIYWNKGGINLIFFSNDDVGKGGGSTFTHRLVKYLENRGFNVWVIYWMDSKEEREEVDGREIRVSLKMRERWNIRDRLKRLIGEDILGDCKIILRSYIPIRELEDLEEYKIIFFVPGIFKNSLDEDWREKEDIVKYVNRSNLKIADRVESYSNSELTRSIYQTYGFANMGLLEINLLQIENEEWNNKRDIDVLFVVSDINRQIKNVKLFLEIRKVLKGKFVLISGEKVSKKVDGIEYVEQLKEYEVKDYYKRSKILINCSYFDSMSNTILEGIKYGCYVLFSYNNGITSYVNNKHRIVGYDVKEWSNKCKEVLDNFEESRDTFRELVRKSWEVEIRLLEILSNTRYG